MGKNNKTSQRFKKIKRRGKVCYKNARLSLSLCACVYRYTYPRSFSEKTRKKKMRDPYSHSYSSSRKSKSTFVDGREAEREEILRRLKKKKKNEEEEEARYLKTREEVRREGLDALLHRAERSRAGGATTDLDELKKHHRFLREEEEEEEKFVKTGGRGGGGRKNEEEEAMLLNEGERVAMKYEEKLFKEYAIPDLSRCDEGVGLRWRTEKEVARGKGVDICGEKSCSERKNLGTFELNFRYKERGEVKNALVKVVVCPVCEEKLHRSRRKKKKGR